MSNKQSSFIFFVRGLFFVIFLIIFFFVKCSGKEEENSSEIQTQETTEESPNNDSDTESSSTCNSCGRDFFGSGYEEQLDGSINELEYPYSNQLCSPSCARKASQKLEDVADKYGIDLNESSSSRCERCRGKYVDGFCNLCGGASRERVNQSNQNRANCQMCQGNKYVDGYDGVKICTVCNGTGKESY
jgi:hypothetical protein